MAQQSEEMVRKFLLDGLRDAHAMECQALTLNSAQADRLENYADLERDIRLHIRETEGQRDRLEQCLARYDATPSALKDTALKISGGTAAIVHTMASDEVVKNTMASYAFEHFEIAAYRSLAETAKLLGDQEVLRICEESLHEEEQMASRLAKHLPDVVRKYLSRSSADVQAKR